MNTHRMQSRTLPLATVALGAVALILQCIGPQALEILEWRALASVVAEPMRLATGHLCHWSWQQLAWDLGAFLVLGAIVEPLGRGRMLATLALASLLSHAFLRWNGEYDSYRGLSAWAMALYASAMLECIRGGLRLRRWGFVALGAAGWLLALAKCGAELLAAEPLFASGGPVAFNVAVEAHLAGLLAPLGPAAWAGRTRARGAPSICLAAAS